MELIYILIYKYNSISIARKINVIIGNFNKEFKSIVTKIYFDILNNLF